MGCCLLGVEMILEASFLRWIVCKDGGQRFLPLLSLQGQRHESWCVLFLPLNLGWACNLLWPTP